ncbi:MAG: hypothetical protein WC622_01570 [Pedobacter sp.]|uniref:hypothetical protein n=1 Tax=Pedobacter sp. TaxID=1411316 RepID=UPI003567C518
MIACNSSAKNEEESDSALVAPVDTLGGDTTRHSMTDSSATSGVDTTQRNP